MTTTQTHTTTGYDVARALLANDVPQTAAHTIGNAVNKLQQHEDQLLKLGADIARDIERVNQRLANGRHLNRLGELQSSALRYDMLCAQRQDAVEFVLTLCDALLADEVDAEYVRNVISKQA